MYQLWQVIGKFPRPTMIEKAEKALWSVIFDAARGSDVTENLYNALLEISAMDIEDHRWFPEVWDSTQDALASHGGGSGTTESADGGPSTTGGERQGDTSAADDQQDRRDPPSPNPSPSSPFGQPHLLLRERGDNGGAHGSREPEEAQGKDGGEQERDGAQEKDGEQDIDGEQGRNAEQERDAEQGRGAEQERDAMDGQSVGGAPRESDDMNVHSSQDVNGGPDDRNTSQDVPERMDVDAAAEDEGGGRDHIPTRKSKCLAHKSPPRWPEKSQARLRKKTPGNVRKSVVKKVQMETVQRDGLFHNIDHKNINIPKPTYSSKNMLAEVTLIDLTSLEVSQICLASFGHLTLVHIG